MCSAPGVNLLANVCEHHLRLHHAKSSLVHRHHGAMAAQMFAAPAGFGVTGLFRRTIDLKPRVFF